MSQEERIWAIVPAAGIGQRMMSDQPKQYLPLDGRRVLDYSLEVLCRSPLVDGLVVGIRAGDPEWERQPFRHGKLLAVSPGGEERAHTVLKALECLLAMDKCSGDDWVMVHDAVRPCLLQRDIDRLVAAAHYNGTGALLAMRVVDTLKREDMAGDIETTVEREGLWRAMTPQMFRIDGLKSAMEESFQQGVVSTDESAAMERAGARPAAVECDPTNIKITLPGDLELAELYLGSR